MQILSKAQPDLNLTRANLKNILAWGRYISQKHPDSWTKSDAKLYYLVDNELKKLAQRTNSNK